MIRGIYSAASGLDAYSLNQDVVAENLANASTPGFRQQGVVYQSFDLALNGQLTGPEDNGGLLGVVPSQAFTNFQPGPLQYTGNPLDLAASGNVFFVLDGQTGPELSRNGTFVLNGNGEVVNTSGLRVRSEGGGPLTIPAQTREIGVSADGFVFADGQQVGRLQLEVVANPAVLQRVGPSLFSGIQPGNAPPAGTAVVTRGYRELSNVNPVQEMVSMIAGSRYYEAAQRALRSLSDAIELNTRPTSA
jgi:flagellar basal body rod protein FlgG